jgi:hypothetical protein
MIYGLGNEKSAKSKQKTPKIKTKNFATTYLFPIF